MKKACCEICILQTCLRGVKIRGSWALIFPPLLSYSYIQHLYRHQEDELCSTACRKDLFFFSSCFRDLVFLCLFYSTQPQTRDENWVKTNTAEKHRHSVATGNGLHCKQSRGSTLNFNITVSDILRENICSISSSWMAFHCFQ